MNYSRIQVSLQREKSAINSFTLSSKLIRGLWGFMKNSPNKAEFGDRLGWVKLIFI